MELLFQCVIFRGMSNGIMEIRSAPSRTLDSNPRRPLDVVRVIGLGLVLNKCPVSFGDILVVMLVSPDLGKGVSVSCVLTYADCVNQ